MRALSRISRQAAAALVGRLVMSPPRRRPLPAEREVLAAGRSFVVRSAGRRIAAWSWGSGPTVVLVHGWGGDAAQMTPFVAPLVAAGRRAVAFDAGAHGTSSGRHSSVVDMARTLADVAAVVGQVDAVIAHSAGGAATTLAVNGGLTVRRIAYVAPALRPGGFLRRVLRRLRLDVRLIRAAERWMEQRVGTTFADLHRGVAEPADVPLLVVHDEDDRVVPVAEGRALAERWPGARLEVTAGLGHARVLADGAVVRSVVHFVAGTLPCDGGPGSRRD